MLGLRTLVPLPDFIGALRDEKLLAVPAGESVARLLPALIVGEAEMDDAVARIENACERIDAALRAQAALPGAA
jgi:acetylornithine/N-succinyldiaminopimelate aminotransferase